MHGRSILLFSKPTRPAIYRSVNDALADERKVLTYAMHENTNICLSAIEVTHALLTVGPKGRFKL